eukprot:5359732-Prymnesium_polylepis.1
MSHESLAWLLALLLAKHATHACNATRVTSTCAQTNTQTERSANKGRRADSPQRQRTHRTSHNSDTAGFSLYTNSSVSRKSSPALSLIAPGAVSCSGSALRLRDGCSS